MPVTFAGANDAFAVYLTPGFATGFSSTLADAGTGQCMDENDWTTVSAAQLQQWTCNSGTNQEFCFVPTSAGSSTYFVQPMTPDYCLDVNLGSMASGAAIIQYPCNYNSNEEFTLTSVGTNEYHVVAENSGLCVAPSGGSTTVALPSSRSPARVPTPPGRSQDDVQPPAQLRRWAWDPESRPHAHRGCQGMSQIQKSVIRTPVSALITRRR